jgi:hypothetical protein
MSMQLKDDLHNYGVKLPQKFEFSVRSCRQTLYNGLGPLFCPNLGEKKSKFARNK